MTTLAAVFPPPLGSTARIRPTHHIVMSSKHGQPEPLLIATALGCSDTYATCSVVSACGVNPSQLLNLTGLPRRLLFSPDMETRNSYTPLGPRDTFPFVQEDARKVASERSLLFNLEVR